MLDENNKNRVLLPDGRVMKHGGRAEAVVTEYEERVTIQPLHWKSNRMVRRDFNSMMVRMARKLRELKSQKTFERMLLDLEHEAHFLADSTLAIEVPAPGEFCELPLRLVSPEAKRLIDALVAYDKALAKLTVQDGLISAEEHCADFSLQYARLKQWLFEK